MDIDQHQGRSGTPIAGWLEHKVRMIAQNQSWGGGGAVSMTFPWQLSQAVRAQGPSPPPVFSIPALWHYSLGLPRCGDDTL